MSTSLFDLSGHVALVTGASSGIGQAIAVALAGAGAQVVAVARRRDRLDETVATITAAGGRGAALVADLDDRAAPAALAEAAAEPFGPPDILVNAAGINLRESADAITPESWAQTLDIHVTAPFFLARALAPDMRRQGWGRIINIASLQSARAFPNGLAYGTAKGGVVQMTRAMAEAWSRDGINCNAIAPGFFHTELTAPVFADSDQAEANARRTMIGRNGRMQDLHGVAIFLAAPASDYITGQTIFVDGGFSAK